MKVHANGEYLDAKNVLQTDGYVVSEWIGMWVIINTLLVIQMLMKLMYFLRISGELSKLIKLVRQVFSDVFAFTFFFFGWVFVFVMLYQIAGIDLVDKQTEGPYKDLNRGLALYIQSFRNSFGDITDPLYDFWLIDNHKSPKLKSSNFFVLWAWFLFIFHEFFLLIVLLNFLIAIVSQSYDNIMDSQEVEKQQSRIFLNNEAAIILDFINFVIKLRGFEPCQIFHFVSDFESESEEPDQF